MKASASDKIDEAAKSSSLTAATAASTANKRPALNSKRNRLFETVMSDLKKQETRLKEGANPKGAGVSIGGAGGSKKVFFRFDKVKRNTESYVDRDRAAGVTLGSSDIKRQMTKRGYEAGNAASASTKALIDETGDWEVQYRFGVQQMQRQAFSAALASFNLALQVDKFQFRVILARSRCFLSLGRFREALDDAEDVLEEDPLAEDDHLIKAFLYKAEALFQLGNFESSAVWFYRYSRVRPGHADDDEIRIGLQKCEKAVNNSLGSQCFNFYSCDRLLEEIAKSFREVSECFPIERGRASASRSTTANGGGNASGTTHSGLETVESAVSGKKAVSFLSVVDEAQPGVTIPKQLQSLTQSWKRTQSRQKAPLAKKKKKAARKKLVREMDELLPGRMQTDEKFLRSIQRDPTLAREERYQSICRETLAFIEDRQNFWSQHDAKKKT